MSVQSKSQKKPFLLFEILIALSLMAILVSILFSFMVQSMKVEKKMEKARSSILERQNLQIRFQDLLTTLAPCAESPSLYTQKFPKQEKESLVAVFDNGIDPDPLFSGVVVGRIYIDENNDLCLAYWPSQTTQEHREWRKEVLLANISDFSLSFLRPNIIANTKLQAIWDPTWPKKNSQLPSIVRLSLKQNDITLKFAFHLGHSHPIPTWSPST